MGAALAARQLVKIYGCKSVTGAREIGFRLEMYPCVDHGFGVYNIASPSEVIDNGCYSSMQGSEQTDDDQDPDLSNSFGKSAVGNVIYTSHLWGIVLKSQYRSLMNITELVILVICHPTEKLVH